MRLILVAAVLVIISAFGGPARGQTPITVPTISPQPPMEVLDGSGSNLPVDVSSLPLDFFDDYSWRLFVALNWPAKDEAGRGVADATKTVGDSGRRVWKLGRRPTKLFLRAPPLPTPRHLGRRSTARLLAQNSMFQQWGVERRGLSGFGSRLETSTNLVLARSTFQTH